MEASRIQTVLQALIGDQQRSLLPRLVESTVFVDAHSAGELASVRRMAAEHDLDEQRLAELLIGHDGLPGPRACEITSADFHFVGLDTIIGHVERYWCSTMTSSSITGKSSFVFLNNKVAATR